MELRVLSLFDGISCGQVALGKLDIRPKVYYASEIDKNPIKVTQARYPNTIQVGDATKLKGDYFTDIDLMMGGSPCQGFSVAGKGLDFEDPRSKLFFTFADLLEEIKPRYWLLENVKMKQWCQDVISDRLRIQPIEIDSADFSAQQRKRLYWTNIPVSSWEKSTAMVENILEPEVDSKYLIDPRRAVIILENEVGRRKIAYIGSDSQGNRIYGIHGKSVTFCGDSGGLGAKTGLYALPCLTPDRLEKRQNGRRFKPPQSKFYTLTAQDQHGILTNHFIRKLTPTECERLQTLPDGYTDVGLSDNQRYRALGNGWTVDVIAHILSNIS